jgi:protease-4
MHDDERAYFQQILDSIHEQFIKDVAEGRKMPVEQAKKLSDGRVYTGSQAKELGLIDSIGTFYDTVDDMKKALGIKGKPVLVYGKRPFSFLKWLISSATETIIKHYNSAPVHNNNYRFMPNF